MEQQKTINHFQFKLIDSNRPIDPNHVKKLVAAIGKKDLLHLHPIVVNQKMEVIDGQHRLKAAEQLGLYVHYVVDDNISKCDIATINSNAKNWTILDYINYWATEKADGFDVLTDFMIKHPKISPSVVLVLLAKSEVRNHSDLKEGKIDVANRDKAEEIALALDEIAEQYLFRSAYDSHFVRAVIRAFKLPGYDHNIMRKKIDQQPRSLQRCADVKQYLEMLGEIYNYGSSKNRLNFK